MPPHKRKEAHCVDTQDIPLVPGEGRMLKGSLVLKNPVILRGRRCGIGNGNGDGMLGTFSLPCELGVLCGAWLVCGYEAVEKECCEIKTKCCERG